MTTEDSTAERDFSTLPARVRPEEMVGSQETRSTRDLPDDVNPSQNEALQAGG
ncbi:hypothetical protein Lfu02_65170 [Longispora fulva]|uniref:Uncharacterized protein n=1 Tax=Longispora fulva TaxID=619741 RepID=A0A8J7GS67_9ACTN|nr:hypothetical protein [Longispora fulva]MBG6137699.1 hypothetical protein [Longispora fulva]GIG62145.1 hypothetical protein Lfu02_65170 [Longispora fulva]